MKKFIFKTSHAGDFLVAVDLYTVRNKKTKKVKGYKIECYSSCRSKGELGWINRNYLDTQEILSPLWTKEEVIKEAIAIYDCEKQEIIEKALEKSREKREQEKAIINSFK